MNKKLPKPFLGRLLIEVIETDVSDYLAEKRGLNKTEHLKNIGFQIVDADVEVDELGRKKTKINDRNIVPLNKGRILAMSPDAYGELFVETVGKDHGYTPKVGDVIWFIPNMTQKLDPEGRYHFINDKDVSGYGEFELEEIVNEPVKVGGCKVC